MKETWLPCPDYEGLYEISDLGNVRSLYFDPPRPVARIHDSHQYPVAMLSKDKRRTPKTIHRLVGRAFVPGRNVLHKELAHLDGVRENCAAENLKWVSRGENLYHKRLHKTHQAGERHPRAKLTNEQVRAIRADGRDHSEVARAYGISPTAARDIRTRRRWGHI